MSANRRMFSNRIANSARFLQMPSDSQLLYFHMVLRADDDGIVESYPLMKLLGLAPDNFKVLIAKGFIEELNEDQVIVILDWLEHNKIRPDRKVNSIYLPLLKKRLPELPTITPKPRVDVKDNTKRLDSGQSMDGIGKVRLGKVREGNINNSDSEKSLKRKDFRVSSDTYKELTDAYQLHKGIKLEGAEFGEVKRAIKTMIYSGRSQKDIINFMEFCAKVCEEIDSGNDNVKDKFGWFENWTMLTIKRKLPEFLADKFVLDKKWNEM